MRDNDQTEKYPRTLNRHFFSLGCLIISTFYPLPQLFLGSSSSFSPSPSLSHRVNADGKDNNWIQLLVVVFCLYFLSGQQRFLLFGSFWFVLLCFALFVWLCFFFFGKHANNMPHNLVRCRFVYYRLRNKLMAAMCTTVQYRLFRSVLPSRQK